MQSNLTYSNNHPYTKHVERDIAQLCQSGLDSIGLRRAAMQRLRRTVAFDAYCCGTIDPETLLITSEVSEGIPTSAFAPAAKNEYLTNDVNKFSQLARGPKRTGILSQNERSALEHNPRYLTVLKPSGFTHELRAAFVSDGTCWGGVTLLRNADAPDFTLAEANLLAKLSQKLAEGLQMALLAEQAPTADGELGAGMILLSATGAVEAITPAAQAWLAELVEPGFRVPEGWLPAPVHEVAMRARAIAQAISEGGTPEYTQAHLRVRTYAGQWLMLHGSHVISKGINTGQTAIIFERAHFSQIAQMLMLAYELTPREREVLQLVLKGLSTKEIAQTLHTSAHTVQDQLKAIFNKVGVHSRSELVGRVLGEHYLPFFEPK